MARFNSLIRSNVIFKVPPVCFIVSLLLLAPISHAQNDVLPVPPEHLTIKRQESNGISHLVFMPGSDKLISAGEDGDIKIWDAKTDKELAALQKAAAQPIHTMVLSGDGKTLATGIESDQVILWDTDKLAVRTKIGDKTLGGWPLALSATKAFVRQEPNQIDVWDTQTGKQLDPIKGDWGVPRPLICSQDGKTLAISGRFGVVVLIEVATGKVRSTLRGGNVVLSLAFADDNNTLAALDCSSTASDKLIVWDARAGKPKLSIKARGYAKLALSPDGDILAVNNGLYDVAANKAMAILPTAGPHAHSFNAMAFSPDGKLVAVGGHSPNITIYKMPERKKK